MADAGWYPDPDVQGGQRYFDGTVWTDRRVAPAPPLPPTERQQNTRRLRWGVAIAVVALVAATSAIDAWWPPSAEDRRVEQIKKDCLEQTAAEANRLIISAGIRPSDSQLGQAAIDCDKAHGLPE